MQLSHQSCIMQVLSYNLVHVMCHLSPPAFLSHPPGFACFGEPVLVPCKRSTDSVRPIPIPFEFILLMFCRALGLACTGLDRGDRRARASRRVGRDRGKRASRRAGIGPGEHRSGRARGACEHSGECERWAPGRAITKAGGNQEGGTTKKGAH